MVANLIGGLGDLARDLEKIGTVKTRQAMRKVVHDAAITGNTVAKDNARRTAGRHGKLYPRAFTWEMHGSLFGGAGFTAEYGPIAGRRQGGMSFEEGSRNQPAHNDLKKSADLIGPSFANEVGQAVDGLFW